MASVLRAMGAPEDSGCASQWEEMTRSAAAEEEEAACQKMGRWSRSRGKQEELVSTLQGHLCSPHTTPRWPGKVRQPY